MTQNPDRRSVPSAAAWLGGLGAVPFIGLAAAAWLIGDARPGALLALAAYGAVILSFLGGIHWGLAISGGQTPSMRWLLLSVTPSLLAWVALLLPGALTFLVLAGALAGMLAVDIVTTRRGFAPPWYPHLRVPLSIAVIACMLAGAAAVVA